MVIGDLSVLEKEVTSVFSKGKRFKFPQFTVTLHTPVKDIPLPYTLKITNERNYQDDLTENYLIDAFVSLGDYTKEIFPYKDTLEITITKNDLPKRFKAIITNINRKVDNSLMGNFSKEELDKLDLVHIKLQCVDPIVMLYKQLYVSGIFRDIDLKSTILALHGQALSQSKILGRNVDYRIKIKELNNKKQYNHIIIPTNTKLAKLVTFFQNNDYGLYNGGVGYFAYREFGNDKYYIDVYPVSDYQRYNTDPDSKLLLLDSRYYQLNFNDLDLYYDSDTNTYKLPVSNIDVKNKGAIPLFAAGDTIYETNPNVAVSSDAIAVSDTEVTYDTYGTINEYRVRPDDDGLHSRIPTNWDDNVFKYRSSLYRLMENYVLTTVPMIDDSVLKPGMLVKYMFARDNTVNALRGVLQYVNTEYNLVTTTTSTAIALVLEREVNT